MEVAKQRDITRMLSRWSSGDSWVLNELIPLLYHELHKLACEHMARENGEQTLQATALVHEVYLRLAQRNNPDFLDRTHFIAVAAQIMRCILVDRARKYRYLKRGNGVPNLSLEEGKVAQKGKDPDVIFLDEALEQLKKIDARKSTVVELRVFGGMTIDETASLLGVSTATVINDYRFAKAWIYRQLRQKGA